MTKLEAKVELTLIYPYSKSFLRVLELINTWSFRIYDIQTNSPTALIGITVADFKKIFGQNPKKGIYGVPTKTETFIEKVEVKEVVAQEK